MRKLKQRFGTFLRDEDGLILAEGLLMLPLVIWALVAMFIYWDVFRTINITQKAAYGVADLLSRQKVEIPLAFADGNSRRINLARDIPVEAFTPQLAFLHPIPVTAEAFVALLRAPSVASHFFGPSVIG